MGERALSYSSIVSSANFSYLGGKDCAEAERFSANVPLLPTLFCACLAVLFFFGLPLHAATLQVCPDRCSYGSVGAAVEAAAPGDSIEIKNGTYEENVLLDKRLTLVGTGSEWVTISGSSKERPVLQVSPSVKEVELKKITFSDAWSGEGSNLLPQDEGGPDGLRLSGRTEAFVEDCRFQRNLNGVAVSGSAELTCSNCQFGPNRRAGVRVKDSGRVLLKDCQLTENGETALVAGEGRLTILNSTLRANDKGLLVRDTSRLSLNGAKLSGNGAFNLKLLQFSRAIVRDSVLSGGKIGILLGGSAELEMLNSDVSGASGYGLATYAKECKLGKEDGFYGSISGSNNVFYDHGDGPFCPAELGFLTSESGGEKSYRHVYGTIKFLLALALITTTVFKVVYG